MMLRHHASGYIEVFYRRLRVTVILGYQPGGLRKGLVMRMGNIYCGEGSPR